MFLRLLPFFIFLPLIEVYLLIKIGSLFGAGTTILIVILTGVLGASLARRQGLGVWLRIQQSLARGEFPADDLVDGLLVFAAGLVLITPGILTDCFGFLLLIPSSRGFFRRWLMGRFGGMISTGTTGFSGVFYTRGGGDERDVTGSGD